jgi:hypothetical protein
LQEPADQAVFLEVLEHIPPVAIPASLEAIRRNLKQGAMLIVTVPSTRRSLHQKHYQHFDADSLRTTLTSGFSVREVIGMNFQGGIAQKSLIILSQAARVFYPFLRYTGALYGVRGMMERDHRRTLTSHKLDECARLLAICEAT